MLALNKNELPFDLSQHLKQEIADLLVEQNWNRYPSIFNQELKTNIVRRYQIAPNCVFVGNGSCGLLQQLICLYKNRCSRLVFPVPSFIMYPLYGRMYELECIPWQVNQQMEYDYENYPGQDGSICVICHPNNPSGNLIDSKFLEKRIQQEPNSIFIIDEAYIEFSQQSLVHWVRQYENVIVMHTLSKALGLAGVRLGWALCHPKTAAFLSKNEIPYQLNYFSIIAGNYILQHHQQKIKPIIQQVIVEREALYKQLSTLFEGTAHQVFPSEANFLLVRIAIPDFLEQMQKQQIHIAPIKDFEYYFRITIGTKSENDYCVQAIEQILALTLNL